MTDYLSVCGRVRGQQSQLLSIPRLDRMIGASTVVEAFHVLNELQYAEYVDESTTPEDFHTIIEKGLLETKTWIMAETQNDPALQFLWLRYDVNNLKRALKEKNIQKKETLHFSEENGYASLGNLSAETLQEIVWGQSFPADFPAEIAQTLTTLQTSTDIAQIENKLDQAMMQVLSQIATGDVFLQDFFDFIANTTNIRIIARQLLVQGGTVDPSKQIPFGSFGDAKITKTEDLVTAIGTGMFAELGIVLADTTISDEEKSNTIEKLIDQKYRNFWQEKEWGEFNSIIIPMRYFEQRMSNARYIRFIMMAKFNQMTPEDIYNSLEKF